ncbi:MAG TPA: ATP-binding protein [Chitinophagaceae bacterium]|nr:ATP-binding protein [Chitinophagaceae bacterium]
MIDRSITKMIVERLFKGKAILLFGPRQTGKSTLMDMLLSEKRNEVLVLNGDDADVRELLANASSSRLKAIIGNKTILLIDEAQRVEDVGLVLKVITDQIRSVQGIATGSSAFELQGKVNEPLTGRKYEFMLYPLSFEEMVMHHGLLEEKRLLEHRLIYGYYPEIVTQPGEEKERLRLLASSYLYKDLLMLGQIKKPVILEKILKALALQIGNEVNFTELAQISGADKKTVEKYIDLLEKAFVIFQLSAFSRNVRNEIRKGKKIYFYDCGIRNAIINNFKPLSTRTDAGAIWENFVVTERIKFLKNNKKEALHYFWRTAQQQEIDLLEETEDGLSGFECKWNDRVRAHVPLTFTKNYPGAIVRTISPAVVENFITSIPL